MKVLRELRRNQARESTLGDGVFVSQHLTNRLQHVRQQLTFSYDQELPQQTAPQICRGGKLPVPNTDRVRRILAALEAAVTPEEMNLPGYRFHGLQGKPKRYAVDASGNYRITFGFDGTAAVDVDIEDYH